MRSGFSFKYMVRCARLTTVTGIWYLLGFYRFFTRVLVAPSGKLLLAPKMSLVDENGKFSWTDMDFTADR